MDENYVKQLVVLRLKTIPPNVSFSIGAFGDYTRDALVREVEKGSAVGKEIVGMELKLLREAPKLVGRLRELGKTAFPH